MDSDLSIFLEVQSSPNEFILKEIITKGKAGSTAVEHKTSHFLKLFGNELWGIVNDLKQGRFFLHDYVNYHWLCFIHLGDILSSFRRQGLKDFNSILTFYKTNK